MLPEVLVKEMGENILDEAPGLSVGGFFAVLAGLPASHVEYIPWSKGPDRPYGEVSPYRIIHIKTPGGEPGVLFGAISVTATKWLRIKTVAQTVAINHLVGQPLSQAPQGKDDDKCPL